MNLLAIVYAYLNKDINSITLLDEVKYEIDHNVKTCIYSKDEIEALNKFLIDINTINDNIPNEIDDEEIKRIEDIELSLEIVNNLLKSAKTEEKERDLLNRSKKQLSKEKSETKDGGELYKKVSKLILDTSLVKEKYNNLTSKELLGLISNRKFAIKVPNITQEKFNDLVLVGIENGNREALWSLATSYINRNIDFSLITDYYIEKRDAYYLIELIIALREDLNIQDILRKVSSTNDKAFMNDCASRAVHLELIKPCDINKIAIFSYSYEEFKKYLNMSISNNFNTTYPFILNDNKYAIIGQKDSIIFQKHNNEDKTVTNEEVYNDIDELYNTETIDGIVLKRDWDNIKQEFN